MLRITDRDLKAIGDRVKNESKLSGIPIVYMKGDKMIREFPDGTKREIAPWTEELEEKLKNIKTSLAVEGMQLTDRELEMIRKKHTGEITEEEYMAWCEGK